MSYRTNGPLVLFSHYGQEKINIETTFGRKVTGRTLQDNNNNNMDIFSTVTLIRSLIKYLSEKGPGQHTKILQILSVLKISQIQGLHR